MSRSVEEIKDAIRKHDEAGNDAEVAELQIMLSEAQASAGPAQEEQSGGDSGNIADSILKGATMSLSDEAMGGIGAISSKFLNIFKDLTGMGPGLAPSGITGEDMSMQDMYTGTRDIARRDEEAFAERNPNTALAAEIGGTLMTGGLGGAKVLGSQAIKQAPKAIQALAVPAVFAAEGATYGFGEGEGMEDSLSKAGTGAATSAIVGPVINKALKYGIKKIATPFAKVKREASQASTTLDDLKEGYKAAYKVVDESKVQISEKAYKPFKDFVFAEMKKDYGSVKYFGKMGPAMDKLMSLKNPTLKDLAGIRRMLQSAKKGDPTQQTIANRIDKNITDYIKYLSPTDVTKGKSKILGVGDKLKEGDALFSRHAQGTTLEKMTQRASRAKPGSDDALSAQARSFLNSEKKRIGMDKKVLTKLDDMIEGDTNKQLIRFGASMQPSAASARGPVATMVSGGAGFMAGGPVGAAIAAAVPTVAGSAFSAIANKLTRDEMKAITHIAMNKGQEELGDIVEKMISKYTTGATAATLAATPQATELSDMVMD